MEKKIGYELIVKRVRGFDDARRWIYDLIGAGIVKCGQCSNPATHVFWQDQAEWYCRCDQHREYGSQWTGSTRWNPSSFGLNVLKDKTDDWLSLQSFDQRKRFKLQSYDATPYWDLLTEDYWKHDVRHYLVGERGKDGWSVYVRIMPFVTGEYGYQIHKDWTSPNGGHGQGYLLKGAWPTEEAALEAAKADPDLK